MNSAIEFLPGDRQPDPISRVARFGARLDRELTALENPTPERQRHYLRGKLAWWEAAYQRFVRAIDMDELDLPPNGPDVCDYLLVIAEINTRLARIAP